jgi:hypothetical protein
MRLDSLVKEIVNIVLMTKTKFIKDLKSLTVKVAVDS